MISPLVPSLNSQESAGERLLVDVVNTVERLGSLTVVSRDGPANRRARNRGRQPHHLVVPPRSDRGIPARIGRALGMTPVLSKSDLRVLSEIIRTADVIDLQWQENGLLLPLLRRMNPRSRLVITLHDVLSQRFARQRDAHSSPLRSAVWHMRHHAARFVESQIMKRADHVVVLSDKDAALLPSGRARVHVVPPSIPGTLRRPLVPGVDRATATLLFVAHLARWENEDAMRWFLDEILPRIRTQAPDVRVLVAGGGLGDELSVDLKAAGVEPLGYVDDLEPLYDQADAVVVPLRYGAGVKFKVVDALVRGIPVITTSVGNEGITPADAAIVTDGAEEFAVEVSRVLQNPDTAEAHARAHAPAIADEFGPTRFRQRLEEVYR